MEFKTYEEESQQLKELGELTAEVMGEWDIAPWYPTMEQLKEA